MLLGRRRGQSVSGVPIYLCRTSGSSNPTYIRVEASGEEPHRAVGPLARQSRRGDAARRVARPVFRPRAAALQQHLQGLVFLAAAAAGGCCLGVRDARDVVQNGRPGSSVAPPFAQITEEAPVGVLFVTRASAKGSVVRQRMKGNNKGCRME